MVEIHPLFNEINVIKRVEYMQLLIVSVIELASNFMFIYRMRECTRQPNEHNVSAHTIILHSLTHSLFDKICDAIIIIVPLIAAIRCTLDIE